MREKIFRLGVKNRDPQSKDYHHVNFTADRERYLKALLKDQSDGDRVIFECRWSLHIALAKGWVVPRQQEINHKGVMTPATVFYITRSGKDWANA